MRSLQVSATADYALRAVLRMAACYPASMTAGQLARQESIPKRYLDAIMADLRRADVVLARRGTQGGHRLARDPNTLTLLDILGGLRTPVADIHGGAVEQLPHPPAPGLPGVWQAAGRPWTTSWTGRPLPA